MITVLFYKAKEGFLKGFLVSGHAGFKEYGSDVVCAGVSSAVQMCCNALKEIVRADVTIVCSEAEINLKIKSHSEVVGFFLEALKLQLSLIKKEYDEYIDLKIVEV